jgi:hypothetical protein
VTHDEMVSEIQNRAKRRNVLTHYCRRAQFCGGDPGLPDLVLVGAYGAAWMEVKTPRDQLDPPQVTWMHQLKAAGQKHYVIRQVQLDDGSVDAILDNLAYGQSTLFGAA